MIEYPKSLYRGECDPEKWETCVVQSADEEAACCKDGYCTAEVFFSGAPREDKSKRGKK